VVRLWERAEGRVAGLGSGADSGDQASTGCSGTVGVGIHRRLNVLVVGGVGCMRFDLPLHRLWLRLLECRVDLRCPHGYLD